jgi:hypothetical protein
MMVSVDVCIGGEWSALSPSRCNPKKYPQLPFDRALGGRQNQLGRRGEEKNLAPTGTRTRHLYRLSRASRYINWVIAARSKESWNLIVLLRFHTWTASRSPGCLSKVFKGFSQCFQVNAETEYLNRLLSFVARLTGQFQFLRLSRSYRGLLLRLLQFQSQQKPVSSRHNVVSHELILYFSK